jgi:hypothetical protein
MPEARKRRAVEIRQEKQKEVLIEELRKRPIVQGACQKVGIGRASYYRWRKEDPSFASAVDEAMETGIGIVNDAAETQLMAAIREGNMSAVIFWLKHHHRAYTTRVELLPASQSAIPELTDEQKEIMRQSIGLIADALPLEDPPAKAASITKTNGHDTSQEQSA